MFILRTLPIALFIGLLAVAPAQEFRGAILGRITDPSGAVLAAATVTATQRRHQCEARSQVERRRQLQHSVPAARQVHRAGWKRTASRAAIRPGVIVQINDRVTLDFALELGATRDSITVTAESPMLQIGDGRPGPGGGARDDGPPAHELHERDEPGGHGAGSAGRQRQPDVQRPERHHHQRRQRHRPRQRHHHRRHSQRRLALQRPRRHHPQFRRRPGIQGADHHVRRPERAQQRRRHQLHHPRRDQRHPRQRVLLLLRRALNANGWVRNRHGQTRAPISQYLGGGSVGGPVVLPKLYNGRNRTFFFVNYEQQSQPERIHPLRARAHRARAQGRLLADHLLTNTPLAVYDPATTQIVGSATVRQPFPNNDHSAQPLRPHRRGRT